MIASLASSEKGATEISVSPKVTPLPFDQWLAFLKTLKPKNGSTQLWFKHGHNRFYVGDFDPSGHFLLYATSGVGVDRRRSYCLGDAFTYLSNLSQAEDGGVFYLPTQPIGTPTKEAVSATDDIGIELDSISQEEQLERYAEFTRITGLEFAFVLNSGGKSFHAHLKLDKHYPVEIVHPLRRKSCLALRSDPVTVRLHQPMRAPSFWRKEKNALQSLTSVSDARYTPDQVIAGLRKYYACLGWNFPQTIGEDWWREQFHPLLKGCANHTEQYKLDTARELLAAGEAGYLAEKAAKQAERETRQAERRLSTATRQLTGQTNLVDLVTQTEAQQGADAFNWAGHDWKFSGNKARGCCPFHQSASGSTAWIAPAENGWSFHCTSCTDDKPISPFAYWWYLKNGFGASYPRGRDWAEAASQFLAENGVIAPETAAPYSKNKQITREEWVAKGFGKKPELTPAEERERLIKKLRLTFRTRYWEALKPDFSLGKADIEYEGYCPVPDLFLSRTHLIQGWLGAGKTEAILRALAQQCPDKLIAWLTTRNGLLYQVLVRATPIGLYGFHYQDDVVGNKLLLQSDSSALLTAATDSFKPYSGFAKVDWSKAVLVVDEWRSVRAEILSKPNASEIFPEFERALREAGTLIVADAFLSDVDRAILKRYRGKDRLIYRQKFAKSIKKIKWLEMTTKDGKIAFSHEGAYLDLLDQMAASGGRHLIAVDDCLLAQTIARYLKSSGKKVKLVCSLTPETNAAFMANPDLVIEQEQSDFVVYTPTAQAGLDIQTPFDSGLLICTGILSPCDMLQMLGRGRQCHDWTVLAPRFTGQDSIYTDLDGKRVSAWANQLAAEFDRLELQTSPNTKAWAVWQNVTSDIEKAFNSEYLYCLLEHFFESVETVTVLGTRTSEWRDLRSEQKVENTVKTLTGDVEVGKLLIAQQKAPKTNQEVWAIKAAKLAAKHGGTMSKLKADYDRLMDDPTTTEKDLNEVIGAAKLIASNKTDKLKAYLTVNDEEIYSKYLKRLQSKRFVSFCSPEWKRYTRMRLFRELRLEQLAAVSRSGKLVPGENSYTKDSSLVTKLYQQFRANRELAALFPFIENQRQFWLVVCRCMSAFGFQSCGKKIRQKTDQPVRNGRDRRGNQRYSDSIPAHHSAWYRVEESGSELMRSLLPDLLTEIQQVIEREEAARSDWESRQDRERQEARRIAA